MSGKKEEERVSLLGVRLLRSWGSCKLSLSRFLLLVFSVAVVVVFRARFAVKKKYLFGFNLRSSYFVYPVNKGVSENTWQLRVVKQ